jgi:hypothetical protein
MNQMATRSACVVSFRKIDAPWERGIAMMDGIDGDVMVIIDVNGIPVVDIELWGFETMPGLGCFSVDFP